MEAVESNSKVTRVLAGPGSGKTHVMSCKIRKCLENIEPHRILAVTFTNKAASELSQRLGPQGSGMFIGTLHSLCANILRRNGNLIGIDKNFKICDNGSAIDIMSKICKQVRPSLKGIELLTLYHKYKAIDKDNTAWMTMRRTKFLSDSDISQELFIFARYQEFLLKNNFLDFDELVSMAYKLFKNTRTDWADMFDYVFVDEYQDTSRLQDSVVRHLASRDARLFVVGDPNQSIYGWRGADPTVIADLETRFPEVNTSVLVENHRSSERCVALHNRLVNTGSVSCLKEVRGSQTVLKGFDLPSDELNYVVTKVGQILTRETTRPEQLAILARTNSLVDSFRKALTAIGIPVQSKDTPGVTVTSIHQSKGLEFDTVFVVGVEEGILPSNVSLTIHNSLDEERRILYVAITRASRRVCISWSNIRSSSGGKSRFVMQLGN